MAADYSKSADIVIFSYHRPMQLYALLESMRKNIIAGRGQTNVIYRADTQEYHYGYALVQQDFPEVIFIAQGEEPQRDFKPLTLRASFESPSHYLMFAVDDIIVTDTIDLGECIEALEVTGAHSFHLRLGTNLTECYSMACLQPLPRFQQVTDTILAWQFGGGRADWQYPNSVDMSVYRKRDIERMLKSLPYANPNTFEGNWAGQWQMLRAAFGLCYTTSKTVNIPCNCVQKVFGNRYMQSYSVDELLQIFMSGKKIAIADLEHIQNTAVHMEYNFRFIER